MDEILKDLGWGDGFRIPVANEENRALELEVQKKQKEKENLRSALEVVSDRVAGMKSHLANVQHQLDQNQNLIFAQNNQKAAEENLVKLTRIEENSLTNQIKKIQKELCDSEQRQCNIKTDIERTLQRIEKLKAVIKWDKDALLAWDEEVSRGDDDAQMLEKFMKEDESKFKELELKRQCLGLEVENKKNRLIGLKNDVTSMEQSLDKTAQMFRRQHFDRRALVQQWESSVRVLHQRDEDINRAIEEMGNLKSLAKDRLKDLEEQKTFFENEEKNNREIEREIESLNKHLANTKEQIRLLETILVEESDQLGTLKVVLATSSKEHHKDITKLKGMYKEITVKNEQLAEVREKIEKAKEDYNHFKNKKITAEDRVQRIEDILREEEKILEKNLVEDKKLDSLLSQVKQQLDELLDAEKCQVTSIDKIESCRVTMVKDLAKAKTELMRQKEILYNLDFAYMEKDILLNWMLRVEKERESEEFDKRVKELEGIHSKIVATHNLLTKEVARLEEEMRRMTIDLQGDMKEHNYLRNKCQDKLLLVECGQKQVKSLRLQNQDKQVDENVLKLRVRQAEKAVDRVGGKVFSLEKQRLELEEAMKEREIEIKTLRDVLKVRRRALTEQIANLNSRISLGRLRVEHLKSKHEVAILKLGKDENGEPLSVTYMKIKAAQERFELQEMGDKLDSNIKRTEKEIEAMENTLKVVNASNRAFKDNLQSVDANSPEQAEREELEKKQADLSKEYRKRTSVLEAMDAITMELEEEYRRKVRAEEEIISSWREKDQQAADTDRELKQQGEKLERADKHLRRLVKDIRGTRIQKFQTIEEKDIELRELMEQNEYGLQQLAELVAKTYDTGPVVARYLAEKGLSLPTAKSPAPSLKCPSTTSVPSTGRSTASSRSSKSSDSFSFRSSNCVLSPSVVTLDSTRISDKSGVPSEKTASTEGKKQRPCDSLGRKCDSQKKGSN